MKHLRWSLVALVSCVAACGDDGAIIDAGDTGLADGAVDSAVFMPTTPAPPAAPALPSFGECPAGWTPLDVAGAQSCEPWPAAWEGCPDDQVRFPGDARCAPLGTSCAADGWPADLPADSTVHYVRAGETGGDGSRSAPFGTIAEAVAVATAGDTIAVSVGVYPETFDLPADVALVGACVAETVLDLPAGDLSTHGVLMGAGSSLSNLTVAGLRPGIRASDGECHLRDLQVRVALIALAATGMASVVAERIAIRDTDNQSTDVGFGVFINDTSRVEIRQGVIQRSVAAGIGINGGGSLRVEDVAVTDVVDRPDAGLGNGIAAAAGGTVEALRVVVERVHSAGLFLSGGTNGDLDTVVIRDVESDAFRGDTGYGIGLNVRGTLTAERLHLARTTGAAFTMVGFGLNVTLRDTILQDVRPQLSDMAGGIGFVIDSAESVVMERVLTRGTKGAAIAAINPGTLVEVDDLTTLDLAPELSRMIGAAASVEVRMGADVTVRRLQSPGSIGGAVIATDSDTRLAVEDAVVTDNVPTSAGAGGRGVSVQLGATFSCTRCEVLRSTEAGVMLLGPSGSLSLTDVRVEATAANALNGAGMGIVVLDSGGLDMERFITSNHEVAGLQLVSPGAVSIRDGLIADNPVGVNSQLGTIDPADLSDRVVYRDNGINFDGTSLPVPGGGF